MPLNLLRLKHMGPSPVAAPITVELDKTVPASGNLQVKGQQIWLGPDRAGTPIVLRICTTYLRVFLAGVLIKTVGSKLAASDLHALVHTQQARVITTDPPAELPVSPVIEVERTVNAAGCVGLANKAVSVRFPVAGRLNVTVGQQLQRCAGHAVDRNGAVVLAASQREVVYSQHLRCHGGWIRHRHDQPKQSRPARRSGQRASEP